ncbi:MAG: hypothetical protein U1E97_06800, partial [Alphaproteobacteria bacterium]
MPCASIRRVSATMALLLGLGGCAFMPAYDSEYGARVEKAGGLPKGNLVPALIAVGDKAAQSGDRETALRIYGRAATITPQHPDSAQALERAALLVDQMPAAQSSLGLGAGGNFPDHNSSIHSKALPEQAQSPVWSKPRSSAATVGSAREAGNSQIGGSNEAAGANKAALVQIQIIDLKSDESVSTDLIVKNKNKSADTKPVATATQPQSQDVVIAAADPPVSESTGDTVQRA